MAASVTESWKLSIDKKSVGKYNSDQDIRKYKERTENEKRFFSRDLWNSKSQSQSKISVHSVMVFYGLYATCLWGDEANERLL